MGLFLRMEGDDITVHGFRSTFRDWCSEAEGNNFSREVCEHALAHRRPDKVEGRLSPRRLARQARLADAGVVRLLSSKNNLKAVSAIYLFNKYLTSTCYTRNLQIFAMQVKAENIP